ncbi:MAG TPA: DUF2993 domain-containing protein [Cyanobacteria bacterium UBA8553]|nr:DUF2993 domain-containing protein [Cyanobacteria bacterium UBA8553]HAJ61582.1 DUF2993 domain-containing protein [Cyanobacteria bacterium UBA8543]
MLETPEALKLKKSRIISTVLSPAVGLWLRSQVEQVEALQFKIVGGDRQILTGHIPKITIQASSAIYQGLNLSQIQLEGTDIRVNLPQVLKGKPLRLLEPVPVVGQLLVTQNNLQASLQAPLLANALTEFLYTLLETASRTDLANRLKDQQISWQQITIDAGNLTIFGTLSDADANTTPVVIRTSIKLVTPHELELNSLQIQMQPLFEPIILDRFHADLGSEVEIEELTLTLGQLICRGRLSVIP